MCIHCKSKKKVSDFPVPSRDVTKLPQAENNLIIPGQGEFGYSDIPAGDGKIANHFLQCTYRFTVGGPGHHGARLGFQFCRLQAGHLYTPATKILYVLM
jgi:hypothetical protein